MSRLELPCHVKSKKDGGSLVKPLDKLFDLEAPSEIEDKNVPKELSMHHQFQYVNHMECNDLRKNTSAPTGRLSIRKIRRRPRVQPEQLEHDNQQLMRQSRIYRDKIRQLQSNVCEVLHILGRDNEVWKIIHAEKVPIHSVSDISDTCELQTMAKKIKEDLTAEYRDTGDTRPLRQKKGHRSEACKGLSNTRREIVKRRRWRYVKYLIGRYQGSVVTVAKKNNDLKSKLDVLSKVKVKLRKEVHHLQNLVHCIDLSKPVEQPALSDESQLMPESIPCEVTFALEVEKCALKRSFMTPLPGFLNPVVHLDRCDKIAAYQNRCIPGNIPQRPAETNSR